MNEPSISYSTRMWRLLYPILTFVGIFYVIELLATLLAMAAAVVSIKTGGGTLDYYVMMEQTMKQLDSYAYETNLVAALFTIPVEILYMKQDRIRWEGIVPTYERVPGRYYVITPILGIASCFAINNMLEISGIMRLYSGQVTKAVETLYQGQFLVELIYLVILAPVLEELIFRGLIQQRLRAQGKPEMAIILSTVLFSCYHGNMMLMIYAGILGLILAYSFEKYHNLLASILIHAGANMVSLVGSETDLLDFLYENDVRLFTMTAVWCAVIFGCIYVIYHYVNPEAIRTQAEEPAEEP